MNARLRLFVYGTLKRGGRYHQRFCAGAQTIERASTCGRLRTLPAGYPMLEVPRSSILADGTTDPIADLATQQTTESAGTSSPRNAESSDGPWQEIFGELMTFDDPAQSLPPIDELEDFHPGAPSLYRRVLLPVRLDDGRTTTAWAYVAP